MTPVEDVKPLNESELYSTFQSLASLFELQRKKADEVAEQAGVTQVELACYMRGFADQARAAAWLMRKQIGNGSVAVNERHIEHLGDSLMGWLETMYKVIEGMPLRSWNIDDS